MDKLIAKYSYGQHGEALRGMVRGAKRAVQAGGVDEVLVGSLEEVLAEGMRSYG